MRKSTTLRCGGLKGYLNRDDTAFSSINKVTFGKRSIRFYPYMSGDIHAILPLVLLAQKVRAISGKPCYDSISLLDFETCDDDDPCTFVRGHAGRFRSQRNTLYHIICVA